MPTAEQIQALKLAIECIEGAAKDAGEMGAPSGIVFAGLQAYGMRLATYESILGSLERMGRIVVENNCIKLAA
jgi:hypothetical protein